MTIDDVINKSYDLISDESEIDEEDRIALPTLLRAHDVLRLLAKQWLEDKGAVMPTPRISWYQYGSVDIFWENDRYSMLINVPPDQTEEVTWALLYVNGETYHGYAADTSDILVHLSDE